MPKSNVILWLSLLLVAVVSTTSTAADEYEYEDAGTVVFRFNQILNGYLEHPEFLSDVLADDAVGCFNGECGPAADMYAGSLTGGVTLFMYQTEYFTVTPTHVVMRCWNHLQYASNCMTMFHADSVITVQEGRIVRHEVYVDDEQLSLFLFCQPPGDEEDGGDKDGKDEEKK
jgi:ketosteroid isomerase-like protein